MTTFYLVKEFYLQTNQIRTHTIFDNLDDAKLKAKAIQDRCVKTNLTECTFTWEEITKPNDVIRFLVSYNSKCLKCTSHKHIEISPFKIGITYDRKHNIST